MKIITIIGARPQFIKAAALSREFLKAEIKEIIIHTGQHFDQNMSEIFFNEMNIPTPRYSLGINQMNHGAMTGRMIEEIEKKLLLEHPDFVIVYGDTNSTLAGAIAAKKLKIKLIHVEAGLRSFNMDMPEEINRILTDRISDILFCPTENAVKNLTDEGFENFNCSIINSGDFMQDAANYYLDISDKNSRILREVGIRKEKYILCTIHRAENTDDSQKIKELVNTLNKLSSQYNIVIPLHPRTKSVLKHQNLEFDSNITVISPVGYLDMLSLLKNCALVMTDSGGLQKEAYFFNKFCLTLRDETEWLELIENEYNYLVGTSEKIIINLVNNLINKEFVNKSDLYGGGAAAEKIVSVLKSF